MERFQTIDADEAIELLERVAVAGVSRDVVAGRDEMTRIQAHADTFRSAQMLDDRCEVLEPMPQATSLARRVLQQAHRADAVRASMDFVERRNDFFNSVGLATRRERSRMRDDIRNAVRAAQIRCN